MEMLGLLSLLSWFSEDKKPEATPAPHRGRQINTAAIKSYDKMILDVTKDRIVLKLTPLLQGMGTEERERLAQIVDVIAQEALTAVTAMEKVRNIK